MPLINQRAGLKYLSMLGIDFLRELEIALGVFPVPDADILARKRNPLIQGGFKISAHGRSLPYSVAQPDNGAISNAHRATNTDSRLIRQSQGSAIGL